MPRAADDSKYKYGTEKLDEPALPPLEDKRQFFVGSVLGNRMYLRDKPSGMEPECMTVDITPELISYLHHAGIFSEVEDFKSQSFEERCATLGKKIKAIHQNLDASKLKEVPKSKKELLKSSEMLREEHKDFTSVEIQQVAKLEAVINHLTQKAMQGKQVQLADGSEKVFRISLVKQYYKFGEPITSSDRTGDTNRMRNKEEQLGPVLSNIYHMGWRQLKKLKTSAAEENTNAIGEGFANALANAYQMPAQEQFLLKGEYKDGSLRIMTDCTWKPGIEPLEGKLAGHQYQSCFVDDPTAEELKSDINTKLKHPAQNLALLLIQGDDDCFGSQLQNKMVFADELFGIDFGHAYRGTNTIFDTNNLSLNFTLNNNNMSKYKNISVLFDAPLSDKMLGIFYTYKTLNEEDRGKCFTKEEAASIEKAIENYKIYYTGIGYEKFKSKIDNIKSGCIDEIYKSYDAALLKSKIEYIEKAKITDDATLKRRYQMNAAELEENRAMLLKMYEMHKANSMAILQKFKKRMMLSPENINLLNHLACITSQTRIHDKSGVVNLQYLQIEHNKQVMWDCNEDKNDMVFVATGGTLKATKAKVESYLAEKSELKSVKVVEQDGNITLRVPKNIMAAFREGFSEEQVQIFKEEESLKAKRAKSESSFFSRSTSKESPPNRSKSSPSLGGDGE